MSPSISGKKSENDAMYGISALEATYHQVNDVCRLSVVCFARFFGKTGDSSDLTLVRMIVWLDLD